MKYILTENQKKNLNKKMETFINKEFSDKDFIIDRLDHNGFYIDDERDYPYVGHIQFVTLDEETEEDEIMLYLHIPSEENPEIIPYIELDEDYYDNLTEKFGSLWYEAFKQWVISKIPNYERLGRIPYLEDKSIKEINRGL